VNQALCKPMPEALCPNCKAWLYAEADAFCGQCGRPCADLRLEAFPSVLLVGHHAPDVVFKVSNLSVACVKVDAMPPPSWLSWVRAPAGVIPPGGKAIYTAKAATRTLTQPAAGEISLVTNAGTVTIPIMAIQTNPDIKPKLESFEFWVDGANSTRQMTIEAAPTTGSLRILSLGNPDQPWLRVIPIPKPFVASGSHPIPLTVEIDSSRMARTGLVPGSRHAVRVEVEYEGPHGPATTPLPLAMTVRKRPVMTWREEHLPPASLVAMAHQKVNFTFANLSDEDGGLRNGPLHIEEISLRPPTGLNCAIHQGLVSSSLPADVPGGDSLHCEFELDLDGVTPNLYHFPLLVRSNGLQPVKSFVVPINIGPVPEYDGVIAIDFGTSNTCCALLEADGSEQDLESVALDGDRTTCPTVVRYIDLDGPVPVIETGADIKNLAAASDEVAASSVDRLKQQLGANTFLIAVRPKNSREWRQREVRAAAADYLRHIREVAEWKKQAHFREFILTHPAVCSLQQYRNLRLAIEEAFGTQVRIDFLQEPVAALIPFFAEMAVKSAASAYTVASFDLGGGTTDITLVSVTQKRDAAGHLEIKPEIVTSWGEQFGGEDLTDFLVKELTTRCQQILKRERADFQLVDRQVKGSSTPDVLRNRAALRDGAERLKAGLSEDPAATQRRFTGVLLRAVCTDQDHPMEDIRFDAKKLDAEGAATLEVVFLSYVRTRVSQLALRLKKSAELLPSLDHIHLSGKTTFLPIVRLVLEQNFTAHLHRAGDPKECVVRGACMARAMGRRGRTRRLNLSSASRRTTSSVGLLDDDAEAFRQIIPLDCPIPDGGLDRILAHATKGAGPVVLWENLGFEQERIRPDGTRNPLLRKLGIWEPISPVESDPLTSYGVRLRLNPDFRLFAALIDPDNHVIPLRPHGMQGGV
jgi:hypothetical protein